jgi:serine/threonine-protein kinase
VVEAPEPIPFVGQLLDGRYKIVREIASGGMSTVYEATHVKIGRTVAIKVLHREMAGDPEVVARFLNEARAVGTFGHPNIVASTDFGELPGHVPYLVLEYLEGHTLSQEIAAEGPLPVRRVARIALQIASALDAAHARNVIHRDLTSANIFLVQREGNPDHVKVLDFGISKFLAGGETSPKTRRGLTMGTPEFMAPEQISDPDAVDARVDVYALGVIMYHMLAGQHPFTRTPLQSLLTQIVVEPPPPIERQGIPEGLHAIVLKALAKNPTDRFPSMRDMGIELERLSARVFAGGEWDDQQEPLSFESGSRYRSVPVAVPRSGPVATSAAHRIGPASASTTSGAHAQPPAPATNPAVAPGGGRKLLFVALVLATGSLGGVAFLALQRGMVGGGDPRPEAPAPVAAAPPAPAPPTAPSAPAPVSLKITSPTPQARVTLRGRTHLLPFTDDVKTGSQPEIVELTAPGREGRRFWITFDHPIALTVELPPGRGAVEASAEETVIALGGKPVDGARAPAPSAPAAPAPAPAHHVGGHHAHAGGLTLAKATAGDQRPPAEQPAEPKASASAPSLAKLDSAATAAAKPVPLPAAPKGEAGGAAGAGAAASKPQHVAAATPAAATATHAASPPPGLDRAKTQGFVRSHLGEIQRCYERGKMDEPDLKGRVTLKISVSETGAVTSAAVESSSLHSSSVESCIVGVVRAWKLPAPIGGPAIVSYPFDLH